MQDEHRPRYELALALAFFIYGGGCVPDSAIPDQELLCDPASYVFCRCPGGQSGSKQCNGDGRGFAECLPETGGSCPPRGDGPTTTSSTTTTTTSTGSGGAGGFGGAGGAPVGSGDLLDPCATGNECQSGKCPMGFCTIDCFEIFDCTGFGAECVSFAGEQICMPTCGTLLEPAPEKCDVYGTPIDCGFTPAIDDFQVVTCAPWGPFLQLPPQGTDCDYESQGDLQCNLGHEGMEAVCAEFGLCANGCYAPNDCPDGTECSSIGGDLGSCQ
jgi:hypothetical protein